MDHLFGAIIEEAKGQSSFVEFTISLLASEVEDGWQLSIPCFKLCIELLHVKLHR